jgi:D-alanyl-D-alanine carboxypeptidase
MGSTEPIRPIAVKTIKVKMAPIRAAALESAPPVTPIADEAAAAPAPAPAPGAAPPAAEPTRPAPAAKSEPAKDAKEVPPTVLASAAPSEPLPQAAAKVQPSTPPARSAQVHSGWIIQIGAFDSESEARQRLDAAQNRAKNLLGHADPFTEAVTKGDKTFYRARFAGLERDQAEASCRQLRRNDIACMTVKN